MKAKSLFFTLFLLAAPLFAEVPAAIELPAPQKTGGKPLMQALAERSTSRAFDTRELSPQQLSDLLWAAFGINRANGRRTAPSAKNWQEIDIYVLLKSGAYVYNAKANRLDPVDAGDLRSFGGTQDFVKEAPVTLVYVADLAKMEVKDADQRREWASLNTGHISQNVYLFCASAGLITGARAYIDKAAFAARFKLRPEQYVTLAQSVGYAKN